MNKDKIDKLKDIALKLSNTREITKFTRIGKVGCALLTDTGNYYSGISIETTCGIGFCAEHSAIAEMLKYGETRIEYIVAISEGKILPPCGRCRELIRQINQENFETVVIIGDNKEILLKELLPYPFELLTDEKSYF